MSLTSQYFGQQYRTLLLNIGKLIAPVKLAFSSPLRGLTENNHIFITLMGSYTKIWATTVAHMLTKIVRGKSLVQTEHSTYPGRTFIFKID